MKPGCAGFWLIMKNKRKWKRLPKTKPPLRTEPKPPWKFPSNLCRWCANLLLNIDLNPKGNRLVNFAGLKESHVHDVIIMKEAPNYWVD